LKKVYFFVGTLSKGGAERTVSNLSLSLSPDIQREIILFGTDTRIDYPFSGELRYIDQTRRNTVLNKLLTILRRQSNLRRLKKTDPGAAYISLLEYPNLINLLSADAARTIISVRNHMSTKHRHGLKALFWRTLIRRYYRRAETVVAVSRDIRQDLIDQFNVPAERIQVIYNHYRLDELASRAAMAIDPAWGAFFQQPVIVTMGRINQQKGQWHLIRAFHKVREACPEAKLLILGEGQLQGQLEALVRQLGLAENVAFAGFQSNPHAMIARARVFVLPSLYEGFPNALAEAMACGIPVIASDCHSGPREILAPDEYGLEPVAYGVQPGRFGLLYPVDLDRNLAPEQPLSDSERILADLLVQVLRDDALCQDLASQALARIADFDIRHVVRAWEDLIDHPPAGPSQP
jgi:glycosyltransferase involved in cell wall biosynthesis